MAGLPKIILAGGSGFLGRTIAKWYSERDYEVVVLSRGSAAIPGARNVRWDGETLGEWSHELEGAAALVNLAGRSVNCRYTAVRRREILDSRILSTRILGEAARSCKTPPPVWLNLSTATIYKHTYEAPHSELKGEIGSASEAKDAFSVEVACAWEQQFAAAECPHTRKIALRSAIVFGNEPGCAYDVLRRLVHFGLGGRMAHGRQYVSWIHADDFCRALDWIVSDRHREGVYNLCAPQPLTNSAMMSELRKALKIPFGLPAARWMLEIGAWVLGTETELVVKSRHVIPGRLMAEGFVFSYPSFPDAIRALEVTRSERGK